MENTATKNLLIFLTNKSNSHKKADIQMNIGFFYALQYIEKLSYSLSDKNRSASIAAIHPEPADVIA